jgi:hypothetical protein
MVRRYTVHEGGAEQLRVIGAVVYDRDAEEAAVPVGQAPSCRCGCGQSVTESRKFVSQDHYSIWLRRERFFGRHRKPL